MKERDKWRSPEALARRKKKAKVRNQIRRTKRRRETRLLAIAHYGGCCAWCGETIGQFLTIDHINENGAELRRLVKAQRNEIHLWLWKQGWPTGYQILCFNCQHKKAKQHRAKTLSQKQNSIYSRHSEEKRQRTIFEHYGLSCACCGNADFSVLSINHIDGGGNRHLKAIGARSVYRWLLSNDLPPGFDTKCLNCNIGAAVNGGVCPHVEDR